MCIGLLAAVLAGTGWYVYAAFQPLQLRNLGVTAYHPPAAVELLGTPIPNLNALPAVEVAVAEASAAPATEASARSTKAGADADSRANKKRAHPQPRSQSAVASNPAAAQWGTPWSTQWSNPWSSRGAAQSYAQWPPRGDDRHASAQSGPPAIRGR
jgi:hypothetical protein